MIDVVGIGQQDCHYPRFPSVGRRLDSQESVADDSDRTCLS